MSHTNIVQTKLARQRDKENPAIKQFENLPKKIPYYSRVSQK